MVKKKEKPTLRGDIGITAEALYETRTERLDFMFPGTKKKILPWSSLSLKDKNAFRGFTMDALVVFTGAKYSMEARLSLIKDAAKRRQKRKD